MADAGRQWRQTWPRTNLKIGLIAQRKGPNWLLSKGTHFRCNILIYISSGNNGFFCPANMRSKGIETSQYEMEVRQSSFKYSVCFGISELVKVSYVPGGNAGVVPLLLRCRLHFEFDIPFPPRFCFHIPKNMSTGTQRARNRERRKKGPRSPGSTGSGPITRIGPPLSPILRFGSPDNPARRIYDVLLHPAALTIVLSSDRF